MKKRWIVQKTMLVTHQTVVYAEDQAEALKKYNAGDIESEDKPFYEAAHDDYRGHIKIFEGSEQ